MLARFDEASHLTSNKYIKDFLQRENGLSVIKSDNGDYTIQADMFGLWDRKPGDFFAFEEGNYVYLVLSHIAFVSYKISACISMFKRNRKNSNSQWWTRCVCCPSIPFDVSTEEGNDHLIISSKLVRGIMRRISSSSWSKDEIINFLDNQAKKKLQNKKLLSLSEANRIMNGSSLPNFLKKLTGSENLNTIRSDEMVHSSLFYLLDGKPGNFFYFESYGHAYIVLSHVGDLDGYEDCRRVCVSMYGADLFVDDLKWKWKRFALIYSDLYNLYLKTDMEHARKSCAVARRIVRKAIHCNTFPDVKKIFDQNWDALMV